jgi:hypothetical protein
MKEEIKRRANEAALSDFRNFICGEKEKYQITVDEYEKLFIEYYRAEYRLEFLKEMEKQATQYGKDEREDLKKEQILTLMKINELENSGKLEEFSAFDQAVREMEKKHSAMQAGKG